MPSSETTPLSFERLRFFAGPPRDFWPAFIRTLTGHSGAGVGLLMVREPTEGWHVLAAQGEVGTLEIAPALLAAVADVAFRERFAFERVKEAETSIIGLRIEAGATAPTCAAVLVLRGRTANLQSLAAQLQLVTDTPLLYQNNRRLQQADSELGQFTDALDLILILNEQGSFGALTMTFCNELASRFLAARVSLGWQSGHYIRLEAISHMEKFERRMEAVQRLEAAMEETMDQDEEILFPPPPSGHTITRDHALFAERANVAALLSLPLRIDGRPIGVLLLERSEPPFSEEEVRALRLLCDQAVRRISDLREGSGWFGRRWLRRVRKLGGKIVGVEHTGVKLGVLAAAILLALLIFVRLPYRVEAPFSLRTESLLQVPAPFDGYLEAAAVQVGDTVTPGQALFRLDDRDLVIEQADLAADLRRFRAEAEQAEAEQKIGEMRVAQQRSLQAQAALEHADFRLSRLESKAAESGVVVAGDLRERIGSPVKRGEVLFKITRLDALYAELKVNERDINEVQPVATGELAFTSRPDLTFPFQLTRIEPSALADERANLFIVRARLSVAPDTWWRPGMSGVAKIQVGRRSVLWILTHRAIDYLRLKLWW